MFADRIAIYWKKSHGNGGAVKIDGAPLKLLFVEMLNVILHLRQRGLIDGNGGGKKELLEA